MLINPVLYAQEQYQDNYFYLKKAREFLAKGDCERAEYAYQDYKKDYPQGNAEVERKIAECKKFSTNPNTTLNGEIMYNGYRYVGDYKGNTPNGNGKLYYNNNVYYFYEGTFSDGLRHGQGKLVWKNGQRYEGNWEYDKINGSGTMVFADGNKYVGSFINDNMTKGTYYYNCGDNSGGRYEGEFRNGKRWGNGTMYYKDGGYVIAEWSDDAIDGNFVSYYSNGKKEFVGTAKNGHLNGYCTYYHKNGSYDSGTFVNGERHGYFTEVFYDDKGVKISWNGNYYYGKRDGYWYVYHNDKKSTTFKYQMGKLK